MSSIQDPRLKKNMKAWILQIMYVPYHDYCKRSIMVLVYRNQMIQGTQYEMFSFKGVTYGKVPAGVHVKPKLHPELHPAMLALIEDSKNVHEKERPYVESYIAVALNSSDSAYDWIKLFPECFHAPLQTYIAGGLTDPPELSDERVVEILTKNQPHIDLMRQRMARNLLLP